MQCNSCGHKQRTDDRYCAGCAKPIATNSPTYDSSEPTVFDLDDELFDRDETVTAADLIEPGRNSGRRDSLIGLGVLASLIALVALAITLGGSGDGGDEAAPQDAATATAEPDPTLVAEPGRDQPATPTPVPTSTPIPTSTPQPEMADAIRDLDLGTGWLVTMTADRHPFALNLNTGEEIILERRVPARTGVFVTPRGAYAKSTLSSGPRALEWLGAWSDDPGSGEPQSLGFSNPDGHIMAASYSDPERGTIIITVPDDFRPDAEIIATVLKSGETKVVPGEVSALLPDIVIDFVGRSGEIRPSPAATWITQIDGEVWSWDWDDGWSAVATGAVVTEHATSFDVRRCAAPNECVFERISDDGSVVGELPMVSSNGAVSFSPDGTRAVQTFATSTGSTVAIVDLTTLDIVDAQTSSTMNFPLLTWPPSGKYLIASGLLGNVEVVDAETGEVVAAHQSPETSIQSLPVNFPVVFFSTLDLG